MTSLLCRYSKHRPNNTLSHTYLGVQHCECMKHKWIAANFIVYICIHPVSSAVILGRNGLTSLGCLSRRDLPSNFPSVLRASAAAGWCDPVSASVARWLVALPCELPRETSMRDRPQPQFSLTKEAPLKDVEMRVSRELQRVGVGCAQEAD